MLGLVFGFHITEDLVKLGFVADVVKKWIVVDQVDEPIASQQRTQRNDHDARLGHRVIHLEDLEAIVEQDRNLVPAFDPQAVECVGEPIDAEIELCVREAPSLEHQ